MTHHLAEINVARLVAPLSSPVLAEFVAALPEINALADASPGFVWRLTDDAGDDATALRPLGDDVIVNLSVWESVEALRSYSYRSAHLAFMQRRREWFRPFGRPHMALWWVAAGVRPTLADATRRLARLTENGASADAFTFRTPYPAPGTLAA